MGKLKLYQYPIVLAHNSGALICYNWFMTSEAKSIFDNAMALSASDRADLAARLIESLDDLPEQDVEAAWDQEIARRLTELDSGTVKAIPWPEARTRIMGGRDAKSSR